MAIVTQPLGSAEARGSVGGLTYTTWRGKHVVKARQPLRGPATGLALEMLELAWDADDLWTAASQTDRDAWNDWAAQQREPHWTGQDKRLTGHNWYIRISVRLALLGIGPPTTPPALPVTHSLTGLSLTISEDALFLNWAYDPAPDDAEVLVEIYTAGPMPAGHNATLHDARRFLAAPYLYLQQFLLDSPLGTYTIFCRLLQLSGVAASWQSARITAP